VRRHESEGKVKKCEGATFLSAVIDEGGVGRGICAMDLRSMEVKTYAADAVILCHGRKWRDLRAVDEFGGVHWFGAGGALFSKAWITRTGNSSRCIRRRSLVKTNFA